MQLRYHSELVACLFLFGSLSVHSFLVGLGVSETAAAPSAVRVLFVLLAFGVHKFTDTLILAKTLLNMRLQSVVYFGLLVFFASCVPIGIVVGSVTRGQQWSRALRIFVTWLHALVGGVFFSVAVFDLMMEHAFVDQGCRARRASLFVFFVALVAFTSPFT